MRLVFKTLYEGISPAMMREKIVAMTVCVYGFVFDALLFRFRFPSGRRLRIFYQGLFPATMRRLFTMPIPMLRNVQNRTMVFVHVNGRALHMTAIPHPAVSPHRPARTEPSDAVLRGRDPLRLHAGAVLRPKAPWGLVALVSWLSGSPFILRPGGRISVLR